MPVPQFSYEHFDSKCCSTPLEKTCLCDGFSGLIQSFRQHWLIQSPHVEKVPPCHFWTCIVIPFLNEFCSACVKFHRFRPRRCVWKWELRGTVGEFWWECRHIFYAQSGECFILPGRWVWRKFETLEAELPRGGHLLAGTRQTKSFSRVVCQSSAREISLVCSSVNCCGTQTLWVEPFSLLIFWWIDSRDAAELIQKGHIFRKERTMTSSTRTQEIKLRFQPISSHTTRCSTFSIS